VTLYPNFGLGPSYELANYLMTIQMGLAVMARKGTDRNDLANVARIAIAQFKTSELGSKY
jgi:hypothetical protein